MKQMMKLVGIIAVVAIIGFGFAACGEDDKGDSENIPSEYRGTYTHSDGHKIEIRANDCIWTESGKSPITYNFDYIMFDNQFRFTNDNVEYTDLYVVYNSDFSLNNIVTMKMVSTGNPGESTSVMVNYPHNWTKN